MRHILTDIDLHLNKVKNLILDELDEEPTGTLARIYYNTQLKKVGVFDGNEWIYLNYFSIGTYSEIYQLSNQGKLVPGNMYCITNYDATWTDPVTSLRKSNGCTENDNGDYDRDWYLILTAVSSSEFNPNIVVINNPNKQHIQVNKIIECKYSILPNIGDWVSDFTPDDGLFRGVIYYLKDEFLNESYFDFKHIYFTRWAITDIQANTVVNDGTGNLNPYRCFNDRNTAKIGSIDERLLIGAGTEIEKTLIPAIFNGTNRAIETKGHSSDTGKAYDQDYINNYLKPWNRGDRRKYLAWDTDMNTEYRDSKYGSMFNISVDTEDKANVYLFDYEGKDASNLRSSSGSPLVRSVKIHDSNFAQPTNQILSIPNTVFILSSDITKFTTALSKITIDKSVKSTILLNKISNNACYINDVEIDVLSKCLFIVGYVNLLRIKYSLTKTYINTDYINDVDISNADRLCIIGAIGTTKLVGKAVFIYGTNYYVKYQGEARYRNTADGEYSYDNVFLSWCGGLLLGPIQYCIFGPHFCSTTIWGNYHKGVIIYGHNDPLCFCNIRWGVTIGYSSLLGIDFSNVSIVCCTFPTHSIKECTKQAPAGFAYIDEAHTLPEMNWNECHFFGPMTYEQVVNGWDQCKTVMEEYYTSGTKIVSASKGGNMVAKYMGDILNQ